MPFFIEAVALKEGMMQDDGIHPTEPAQTIMLEAVLPYIEVLL